MGTGMIQYKLVWGRDTETFSAQVTQFVQGGWELYSAPMVISTEVGLWFFQAMVRWKDEEGPQVKYDLAREAEFKGESAPERYREAQLAYPKIPPTRECLRNLDALYHEGFLDG